MADGFIKEGVTRRIFLGGLLGSLAVVGSPALGLSLRRVRKPNMRLGLLSDIHICAEDGDFNKFGDTQTFEHALMWFRDQGVDGVVIAGDMADNGMVAQLKKVGEAWERIFPGNKAPDGRTVEKLFVYGNHDLEGQNYDGYDKRFFDKESFRKGWIRTDPAAAWESVFHEPYAPIWLKRVKGYPFIGAHWVADQWDGIASIEGWFRDHAAEIDRDRPVFYIQHAHPKDTCFGPNIWGQDAGYSTRALSAYPKAVAFSGHAHCPATDDRFIWQGTFTSIGLGSLRYGSTSNVTSLLGGAAINRTSRWKVRQGMLLDVFDDEMILKCRDFVNDEFVRDELVIPIPETTADMRYGFAARAEKSAAPTWPTGAKIVVGGCGQAVRLTFPVAACTNCRVIAYVVCATRPDGVQVERFALQPNEDIALRHVEPTVELDLPSKDFPKGTRFGIIPVNSLGKRGMELVS